MTGAGKFIDSRMTGLVGVAQRVAGGGVLEAHHGDDVAGADAGDLLTLVGVHLVDLADPLLAVLGAVEHLGAGLERAGVDPDVGQLAQVRVAHDLERQRGERLVVARAARQDLVLVADGVALDRARRRAATAGSATTASSMGWTPLFLNAEPHEHRVELAGDRRAADRGDELRPRSAPRPRGTAPSISSSFSASVSSSLSRHSRGGLGVAWPGSSTMSYISPLAVSARQTRAFMPTRSTTPMKSRLGADRDLQHERGRVAGGRRSCRRSGGTRRRCGRAC